MLYEREQIPLIFYMSGVGVLANASFVHRHRSLEETPQNLLSEDCFFKKSVQQYHTQLQKEYERPAPQS